MNWFTYTRAQILLSQRVFWKRLGVALVGTLLPLGFGVFRPLSARGGPPIDGLPGEEFMLTGFIAFALFFVMYNLVNSTTTRRDSLIYKRLRGTSMPDSAIFVGEASSASVSSIGVVAVLIAFGLAYLKLPIPADIPLLILGIILGAAVFALLAIALSGVLPSAEMSMWIITPIMVVLLMVSGILVPVSDLPLGLARVSQYTPLAATVDVVRSGWTGGSPDQSIGVLVAWCAASFAIGRRLFRWDPRRR